MSINRFGVDSGPVKISYPPLFDFYIFYSQQVVITQPAFEHVRQANAALLFNHTALCVGGGTKVVNGFV